VLSDAPSARSFPTPIVVRSGSERTLHEIKEVESHFLRSKPLMLKRLRLAVLLINCVPLLTAQVHHQHGTMPKEEGRYNPFLAADPRGGFYLAYVERKAGISNVMLQRSSNGNTFSAGSLG